MAKIDKDDFKKEDDSTWFRPWRWKEIGLTTEDEDKIIEQDYSICSYSD